MTIHEFDYFHQDRSVNPKHLNSLVRFFESGVLQPQDFGFGVEIEHLPVREGTDDAVTYAEKDGVHEVLNELSALYDPATQYVENGQLLGFSKPGIAVSLEPGGQIECSLGVAHSDEDFARLYTQFRRDIDPILARHHIRLVNYGYQPRTHATDIRIIPKPRYDGMTEFFGRTWRMGWNMMRCSASTQVSIDYSSEEDAIAKLRIGVAIGPILALFFRNSPYFEGEENPWPLLRQYMWDGLDPQRTGVPAGLYDSNYSWEEYAYDVLATPLMVTDLTHTPEYTGDAPVRPAWHDNAADVYPDRELNKAEISHILSTHFPDMRLKNFLEMRHWDSLPFERAQCLTHVVLSNFYDTEQLGNLATYFDGVRAVDVYAAKADLQANGVDAHPYGQSLDFWREFLRAEGSLDDVPGDPTHPDVFQR
ncbi:MAG: glutamate-cysteine ligase family protein [Bifidobacteriaceae bacterium]|nr:glutamate-cysteine ligase family protein [Bifidobacteriaceae bacterium]